MAPPLVQLEGQRFGHLLVLGRSTTHQKLVWDCLCDCGKRVFVVTAALTRRNRQSCGCRGKWVEPGMKFGYLVVTEEVERDGWNNRQWKCRCECGNDTRVRNYSLLSGNTRSCGCKRVVDRRFHGRWRGHGDIGMKIWSHLRDGAVKRGLEFSVSIEEAWDIFLRQGRKCNLTGMDIGFALTINRHRHGETTASLDRIDSGRGYVKDNVQWIHKDVNKMKFDLDQGYFVELCSKVAAHSLKESA